MTPTKTKTRYKRAKRKVQPKRSPKALMPWEYRTYIKSTAWKKKKKFFWEKCKDKRCRSCGKEYEKGFNLHHATYIRLGVERMGDLMPLCDKCHRLLHSFQALKGLNVEDATKQFIKANKHLRTFNQAIETFEIE